MKKLFGKLSIAVASCVAMLGCTPQSEFEIATWRGFKQCAVSFTFEDSYDNQFTTALPLFYKYEYPCTYFLCTRWCNQSKWDAMKEATAKGFEVGSHTVEHAVYDTLTAEQQRQDILDAKARIHVKMPLYRCNTFAYTDCVEGDTNIIKQYFFAVRGCQGYIEPTTPHDFLNISSLVCGRNGAVNSVDAFIKSFSATRKAGGWCVFTIYDIDDGPGYSPLKSSTLEGALAHLQNQEKKNHFWVGTFKDVAKYAKERDNAKVKVEYISSDKITMSLTDGLDNETFDYPLTLRYPLPFGWKEVEVYQNERNVKSEVKTINGCKYIIFEAVPDAGDVYLINLI